jgi:hypothetical protein
MSAFDDNSYSVYSHSVKSYSFFDIVTIIWNPVLQFSLKITRILKLKLDK